MSYTIEKFVRVYDDTNGSYIQICPDADGLDCIDIRSYDSKGQIESNGAARVSMNKEMAVLVTSALVKYMQDLI